MPAKKPAPKKLPAKNATLKNAPPKKAPVKKAPPKKPPRSLPYDQGKWTSVYAREPGERRYWLVKSEPDAFSFDDLLAAPRRTTCWDGVRNTGARNFMRDGMKKGDLVFYYHSNAEPSAIVGICEVVREGYPDASAFDRSSTYFDGDSSADTPTWFMVDVRAVERLPRPVTLPEIKANPKLAEMSLLKVSRLSVVPVLEEEWNTIMGLAGTQN